MALRPNTQMEPARPIDLCDPVTVARGSFVTLDGRAKPRTLNHSDDEENAFSCSGHRGRLHHVGVCFARIGALGRRRAAGSPFGRRRQLGARAVGEAKFRCRAFGWSDHVGVRRARRGTPARRRVSGVSREVRTPSTPRGCSTPAPSFVRACRYLGSLDSSRTPC